MNQYQELDEAILELTSGPNWEKLLVILGAEHDAALQNELDAKSWEDVKFQRGYRAALAFVAQVRETTKTLMEQQADADL